MSLKKELGVLEIFCVASGAMISSGLFILPGLAFAKAGQGVFIAYLIAAFFTLPSMFSKAELATAMPRAGGTYFFIDRSMGPGLGAVGGFASWFSLSLKSAFALVGMGAFVMLISPTLVPYIKLFAVGFCVFFTLLNLFGAKHSARFQVFLVVFLLFIICVYVIFGFNSIKLSRYTQNQANSLVPYGFGSLIATAGFVFVSYGGLTKIASISEEVKNPAKNIPLGMFLAFSTVTVLYALVIFITVGLVEPSQLKNSLTPISQGAKSIFGFTGSVIMAIAAILAFVSTANAGILSASRSPMAMSRDNLLPTIFQKVNPKYKTPHISIITTSLFMISVILFLDITMLVKAASTIKILLFMLVNFSVIIMRESKIQNYRPKFKSPFYPWIQIIGIAGCIYLIIQLGKIPLLISTGFLIFSFGWYWIFAKSKITRKSALIHIVERITAKEIASDSLRTELKDILRERDNIIEDRFDKIIEKSEIIDLKNKMNVNELFTLISDNLSSKLGINKQDLFKMFIDREKASSTVIAKGLAIPHIIVEGENIFEIILIRSKDGIIFSDDKAPVNAVFVLIGSKDERNFHLRTLMSIAQIVREVDFEKNWLKATEKEELRDIILLGKRTRDSK